MSDNPRASIIIPNLNSPVLGEVLMSLSKQTGIENIEIIVVGIDRYNFHPNFPFVKFHFTADPTPPAIARNIGITESIGEIIIFLDADCIVGDDWLEKILRNFEDPAVNVVGGGVLFFHDNFLTLCDNIASFHEYMSSLPRSQKEQLPSLNLAVRRSVIDKIGLFNEAYPYPAGEDAEFTTRIRLQGYTLYFDPEAYVHHKPHRSSIKDLYNHAHRLGQFSIKVDPQYKHVVKNSLLLSNWFLAILSSPILAMGVITKLIFQEKLPPTYWRTLPVVFLIKVFWCFGAASTLRNGKTINKEVA